MSRENYVQINGDVLAGLIAVQGFNKTTFADTVGLCRPVISRATLDGQVTPRTLRIITEYLGIDEGDLTGVKVLRKSVVRDGDGREGCAESLRKCPRNQWRGLLPGQWQFERVRRQMRKHKAAAAQSIR